MNTPRSKSKKISPQIADVAVTPKETVTPEPAAKKEYPIPGEIATAFITGRTLFITMIRNQVISGERTLSAEETAGILDALKATLDDKIALGDQLASAKDDVMASKARIEKAVEALTGEEIDVDLGSARELQGT